MRTRRSFAATAEPWDRSPPLRVIKGQRRLNREAQSGSDSESGTETSRRHSAGPRNAELDAVGVVVGAGFGHRERVAPD